MPDGLGRLVRTFKLHSHPILGSGISFLCRSGVATESLLLIHSETEFAKLEPHSLDKFCPGVMLFCQKTDDIDRIHPQLAFNLGRLWPRRLNERYTKLILHRYLDVGKGILGPCQLHLRII